MRGKIRKLVVFVVILVACVFLMQLLAYATVTLLNPGTESTVEVTESVTEIGENSVRYPQLSGMEDTALQQQINDSIVNEANIAQRLITLSSGGSMQMTDATYQFNQLFSVVISAEGTLESLRSGQQYTALCFDLKTGGRLTLDDFFTDTDAAVAWMEEQLLTGYSDELSPYLEHANLTPLPVNSFSFDENGITFYYPASQYSLFNGVSGSVQFQYGELQDYLIASEGSVPQRLGVILPVYTDAQIKENIESAVAEGTLPYVPVSLDTPIPDLIEQFMLKRTPDQYPGGRYFQLESATFRDVLLLSDNLSDNWDTSVLEGILATRMNLYGIQTGVTPRSRWHEILGDPTVSVPYDSAIAPDYGLPVGTADSYTIAGRQLMLYADENEILYAVRLTK